MEKNQKILIKLVPFRSKKSNLNISQFLNDYSTESHRLVTQQCPPAHPLSLAPSAPVASLLACGSIIRQIGV